MYSLYQSLGVAVTEPDMVALYSASRSVTWAMGMSQASARRCTREDACKTVQRSEKVMTSNIGSLTT